MLKDGDLMNSLYSRNTGTSCSITFIIESNQICVPSEKLLIHILVIVFVLL